MGAPRHLVQLRTARFLGLLALVVALLAALQFVTPMSALAASASSRVVITEVSSSAATSFTVRWKKITGVTGYQVRYSTKKSMAKATKKTVKGAAKKKKKITALKAGTAYYVQVRTYKKSGSKVVSSAWSVKKKIVTRPTKVSIVRLVSKASNAFTVTWKQVKGATGYQVRYSTKKNMAGAVKSSLTLASATKKTVRYLTGGVSYYVQVRARTTGGYGKWSAKSVVVASYEGGSSIIDVTDEWSDPPLADSIAAFGEAAVIVQMLGGEGALAAADSELLEGRFSTVFKDEGAANIATGWEGDGTDASMIDVDAIIGSGATTILVFSGEYPSALSAKDFKKLSLAGISFQVIYPLTNSTYIKNDVKILAHILSESKNIGNTGKVQDIADSYLNFHDDLVKACVKANGGKLAGSTVYETKNVMYGSQGHNSNALYTLLIDGFATGVSYRGSFKSWSPDVSDGVALASIGWSTSPVSFYMQAGGLINNACAQSSAKDVGKRVVWQFSPNQLSFAKSKWEYDANSELANVSGSQTTGGWSEALLAANVDQGLTYGYAFGSEVFPKLIVTNEDYKKAIIANSKKENGIYHPYDHQEVEGVRMSGFGTVVDDSLLFACIGANDSEENLFAGKSGNSIPDSAIEVNPVGLFSSWTEGSVESVLEAAWVCDEVNTADATVGWEDKVTEFYKTFYRYDLTVSDLMTIEAGTVK